MLAQATPMRTQVAAHTGLSQHMITSTRGPAPPPPPPTQPPRAHSQIIDVGLLIEHRASRARELPLAQANQLCTRPQPLLPNKRRHTAGGAGEGAGGAAPTAWLRNCVHVPVVPSLFLSHKVRTKPASQRGLPPSLLRRAQGLVLR